MSASSDHRSRPRVVFVGVQKGGRSQLAAALMRHAAGGAVDSAGTEPAG